jgi:catechol 2,3-dioxygenase-like lactoylglutathione lyase family enzyme
MPPSPPPIVIRYHHLAVVCSDLNVSRKFYEKVGFEEKPETTAMSSSCILVNAGGFELHMLKTGRRVEDEKNILMDYPDEKFPGHTHMSFGVGSVPGVVAYFEKEQIPLSGTRSIPGIPGLAAVFIRDPDRTVLEFERNDGGNDDGLEITSAVLSLAPRGGIDHVGTRVSNPKVALEWYMRVLGFGDKVLFYEHNETDTKKNFRPWIIRTQHGKRPPTGEVDINLIINATTTGKNVLVSTDQDLLPGILYAAYVVESVEVAIQAIDPADIAKTEDELKAWGIIASVHVLHVGSKSCFVRDLDKNIFRLLES